MGKGGADEKSPLLPQFHKDDEGTAQLRDRVTTQYTTIALVSALLSAVSFAAYSTPPSAIFGSASTSPPTPPPGPPAAHGPAAAPAPTGWRADLAHLHVSTSTFDAVMTVVYALLFKAYGLVMPLAFVCNLLGTLAASGVILYANSTLANGPSVRRLFGDKNNEHHIIKYPAAFLVLGVGSLFVGFCIGVALFYGLAVAALSLAGTVVAALVYERFFAHSKSNDTFNALNLSLGALFFRSCLPDVGRAADEHPVAHALAEELDGAAAAGEAGAVPTAGGGAGGLEEGGSAATEAEEAEERERKRAEWEERAEAIGRAVAAELRAEPLLVTRQDPGAETRDFAKKGCCR